jgi:hypothetical protein
MPGNAGTCGENPSGTYDTTPLISDPGIPRFIPHLGVRRAIQVLVFGSLEEEISNEKGLVDRIGSGGFVLHITGTGNIAFYF